MGAHANFRRYIPFWYVFWTSQKSGSSYELRLRLRTIAARAHMYVFDDPKRQWAKTLVHHTIVDALVRFLKDCGMVDVCVAQADNQDRDVDLYHWSSAKFEATWRDTLSVLVARGRAQVGVHSAKTDWSRRILDFQYMDYDDQAAHHA